MRIRYSLQNLRIYNFGTNLLHIKLIHVTYFLCVTLSNSSVYTPNKMNPDYAYAGYRNLDDSTSDVTTRQFLNSGQDWKL